MKLYNPQPIRFVRLMISQQGQGTEYLNFVETTRTEMKEFLVALIGKQNISPFVKGNKTSIVVRDAIGGDNGKSESISFRGLTPKQVHELILNNLPKDS